MKKLILVLLCALMFVGCAKATYDGRSFGSESFINLELIAVSLTLGDIYKDTNTGVLYFAKGHKMTAIMETDGTCLTWDEWTKRINTTN